MALKKCPECDNEVSTTAKACPKCGAEMPKPTSTVTWIVALLIVFSMGAGISANSERYEREAKEAIAEQTRVAALSPEQRLAEEKNKAEQAVINAKIEEINTARSVCKQFVTKTLHDPKSAEFDDFRSYPAKEIKPGLYHVQVKLSAKNGFNAMRRIMVNCKTQVTGGGDWTAVSIKESL